LYLALATFGIAVALPSILKKFDGFTGGSSGLSLFSQLTGHGVGVTVLGHRLTNNDWLYALTWTIAIPLFLLAWWLVSSRFGRSIRAVRDSELAAAASGVNRSAYKVAAFSISAAYAGIAGSLYAVVATFVNPDTFPITLSLYLLVGAVVGGYGSIWGALFGALLIQFMPDLVDLAPRIDPKQGGPRTFVFGAILVGVIILLPLLSRLTNRVYTRAGS
jgi:branched-chain amino acid transport system permease protein